MIKEEKARAYDKALKQAKKFHTPDSNNSNLKAVLELIFPELAESEDEKIRKEIIHYILYKADGVSEEQEHNWVTYLEKQKEQKPTVYIPKFKVGDKVLSTKNPRLTYDILEVGLINELGKPDYRVEIFADGIPGTPELKKEHNIQLIDCQKMDSWGELIEQKPAEWSEEDLQHKSWILECLADGEKKMPEYAEDFQAAYKWLKSLRHKPHWKPSEEQMEALNEAIGDYNAEDTASCEKTADILKSLYNDLEKL